MDTEIFEKLSVLIKKYADIDEGVPLTEETRFWKDLDMSSIQMICLAGDIEEMFSLKLRFEEMGKIVTVADAVHYITKLKKTQ